MNKQLPRVALSAAIIAFFGYGLMEHWNDGLEQVLKDGFMIVVGYWLGSSNGSFNKDERNRNATD